MTKITSKAINMTMTDAINSSINEHFLSVLDNFENFVVEDIIVTVIDHSTQSTGKAEVKAHVPIAGNDIHVSHTGDEMYKTIEEAAQIVLKQMRKIKGKQNNKGAETIRYASVELDLDETEV